MLIHTVEGVEGGWYETDRGALPVSPEVLKEALESGNVLKVGAQTPTGGSETVGVQRKPIGEQPTPEPPTSTPTGVSAKTESQSNQASAQSASESLTQTPTGGSAKTNPESVQPEHVTPQTPTGVSASRKPIPNDTIRRLYARAGQRCERCGSSGCRLHIHHQTPVSEGGGNDLHLLELVCPACHSFGHEVDFEQKPYWRRARDGAVEAACR